MTRRVWVLPPTWSLEPEGSAGDSPKKRGRRRGDLGRHRLGWLRAKGRKPEAGGAPTPVPKKEWGGP